VLNRERFFRFGLDLQLDEIDRPTDLSGWTDKPFTTSKGAPKGFVEENSETLLSVNLGTLLPDEEWLVIGRQESAVGDPDLTAISKACDLVLLEIKRGKAEPEIIEQGLDYLIHAQALRYPHYLYRYLRLQCNRDYVEAIRLLGLAQGRPRDKSGPVQKGNWERLEKFNSTSIASEEYLSLARDLLERLDCTAFTVLSQPQAALAEKFRSHFGFDGDHLLEERLGNSVNLAFVAEEFSEEVLNKVQRHYQRKTFFYVLSAKLYQHKSDRSSFLLQFEHLVPEGLMGDGDPTPLATAFEMWRFLGFLNQEVLRLEALNRQSGRDLLRIPLYRWMWSFSNYNNLQFFPNEAGYYGDVHVDWHSLVVRWRITWMTQGTRRGTLDRIKSRLKAEKDQLPPGVRFTRQNGALVKELQIPSERNRSNAQDLAKDVYDFLTYSFEFYDSCGLWEDRFDYYRRPD